MVSNATSRMFKSKGLCRRCGKAVEGIRSGKVLCALCKEVNALQQKKRMAARKAKGCCTVCGGDAKTGKTKCQICIDNNRQSQLRRKFEFQALGLCWGCGKTAPIEGNNWCRVCILKSASKGNLKSISRWQDLADLYDAQGGVCPYLGMPITIGIDAQLDHIVARSKGGANELSNLQWVSTWANRMKHDDSHEEFIAKLEKALPTMYYTTRTRA